MKDLLQPQSTEAHRAFAALAGSHANPTLGAYKGELHNRLGSIQWPRHDPVEEQPGVGGVASHSSMPVDSECIRASLLVCMQFAHWVAAVQKLMCPELLMEMIEQKIQPNALGLDIATQAAEAGYSNPSHTSRHM